MADNPSNFGKHIAFSLTLPVALWFWLWLLLVDKNHVLAELPFASPIIERFQSTSTIGRIVWFVLGLVSSFVLWIVAVYTLIRGDAPRLVWYIVFGVSEGGFVGFLASIVCFAGVKRDALPYVLPLAVLFGTLAGMWVHLWQMRR